MAIDSIGPKMVIQAANEVAKDTSAIQKHGDIMQNAAQKQVQNEAARMQDEVVDVYEPEHAVIQRERERRQKERRNRRKGTGANAQEDQEGEQASPQVGPGERRSIDIRI